MLSNKTWHTIHRDSLTWKNGMPSANYDTLDACTVGPDGVNYGSNPVLSMDFLDYDREGEE